MSYRKTDIDSVTKIDLSMLTAADLYMAKVVVQHGPTLVDKRIEMICGEYITVWIEEHRGRCTLRLLWNLNFHYVGVNMRGGNRRVSVGC
jgi:hypothetical protein